MVTVAAIAVVEVGMKVDFAARADKVAKKEVNRAATVDRDQVLEQ